MWFLAHFQNIIDRFGIFMYVDTVQLPASQGKFRKIKFNSKRFQFLESEIKRLEEQIDRLSLEIKIEDEKGNTKRASQKQKKLDLNESSLELIYEEWIAMGDKVKSKS